MLASALTITVIIFIIAGVSLYAYRRVTKVHREAQARTAAHEAALLAEVTANAPTAKSTSQHGLNRHTVSTSKEAGRATATIAPVPEPTPEPARAEPVSVQDEIRAFLGDTSAAPGNEGVADDDVPARESDTTPAEAETEAETEASPAAVDEEPSLPSSFDVATEGLAQALRDAATLVEESAASPGTQQERASRTLLAVTTAIGALPLASLITVERDPRP